MPPGAGVTEPIAYEVELVDIVAKPVAAAWHAAAAPTATVRPSVATSRTAAP
jgi:hypothetical protein